jgi:hypothetical protein
MNILILFFLSFLFIGSVDAAEFSLGKLSDYDYERMTKEIESEIKSDNTGIEVVPFNKAQSFSISKADSQEKGYLIPVKFNSRAYKNSICRLYYFLPQGDKKYVDVFAEKNDGDDVVPSCVGVEAVSLWRDKSDVYYLMVIRFRVGNSYKSKGVSVQYTKNDLVYSAKINNCIAKKEGVESILVLRKKMLSCVG